MRLLPALAVAALACTGCLPAGANLEPGSPYTATTLTAYRADRIHVTGDQHQTIMTGVGEAGATRIAWWPTDQPATVQQGACATWASATNPFWQPGIALRIAPPRLVTVTRNVYANDQTLINVHVWDLDRPNDDGRATLLASVPMPILSEPGPLRMCAQVIGTVVRWKIWPTCCPEPSWGDRATSAMTVPVLDGEWAGAAGWYVGHLQPDASAIYIDLTTEGL